MNNRCEDKSRKSSRRWSARGISVGLCCAVLLAGVGCDGDDPDNPKTQDLGIDASSTDQRVVDLPAVMPDQQQPDSALTAYKVAAIQYGGSDYQSVSGCTDDNCGLIHFIKEAATAGAHLVVTSEGAPDQEEVEPSPAIGDTPATDARWTDPMVIKIYSKLAHEQNITLVVHVTTNGGAMRPYSTLLVFDAAGTVIAKHYKFELFGGESDYYTPGTSLDTSFFETPAGKVGMFICADVQCIVTELNPSPDCAEASIDLIKEFFMQPKPDIVLLSSAWTIGGLGMWGAITVQQKIAKDGDVYLVAANTTNGDGNGGGIYAPGGAPIDQKIGSNPSVAYADLPLK